jgi:hypothetical protein
MMFLNGQDSSDLVHLGEITGGEHVHIRNLDIPAKKTSSTVLALIYIEDKD